MCIRDRAIKAQENCPFLGHRDFRFFFSATNDANYVDSILKRENGDRGWAEYTLNKSVFPSNGYSHEKIRSLFEELIDTLMSRETLGDTFSSNILFSSSDGLKTSVVRYWRCWDKPEADQFKFYECWDGLDEILYFARYHGSGDERKGDTLGKPGTMRPV